MTFVLPKTLADIIKGNDMTVEDVAFIRIYLGNTNDITLEQIDRALTTARTNYEYSQKQLKDYKSIEGIEVSILNRIKRSATKGPAQQELGKFQIDDATKRFWAFHDAFCEQISEYKASVDALVKLRKVFTSMYPEAIVSPRTPRLQLEASPTRHFIKSKSSPSVTPRN